MKECSERNRGNHNKKWMKVATRKTLATESTLCQRERPVERPHTLDQVSMYCVLWFAWHHVVSTDMQSRIVGCLSWTVHVVWALHITQRTHAIQRHCMSEGSMLIVIFIHLQSEPVQKLITVLPMAEPLPQLQHGPTLLVTSAKNLSRGVANLCHCNYSGTHTYTQV